MSSSQQFSLEDVRTDGWFERAGEENGSFQALSDILGPKFLAFSLITGQRISALTLDRNAPDQSLVEFETGELSSAPMHLPLGEFRHHIVQSLQFDVYQNEVPTTPDDCEGLQRHIGEHYVLLAPLYGYILERLERSTLGSSLVVTNHGVEERYGLDAFRSHLRQRVLAELSQMEQPKSGRAIDLAHIPQAEELTQRGEYAEVVELLGSWLAPLTMFLRTPEGQLLNAEARELISQGLGLLGNASAALGEFQTGEEALRLAIQYIGDNRRAAGAYLNLGQALLAQDRSDESIAPLRRAAALGIPGKEVWFALGEAFLVNGRCLGAYGAVEEAQLAGATEEDVAQLREKIEAQLEPHLGRWLDLVDRDMLPSSEV